MSSYLFFTGDWDGDGVDGIGAWDPANATFHLRNSNTPGPPDVSINYGIWRYVPVVGDWDGDGHDTIGVSGSRGGVDGTLSYSAQSNTTCATTASRS